MDALTDILLLEDLENKIKTTTREIRNLKLHCEEFKCFHSILNEKFCFPITVAPYCGKIMYIDWILCQNVVYLSLNCSYNKHGRLKSVDTVAQTGDIVLITDVWNIRTLGGRRFKKFIDVGKDNLVNTIDIIALMPDDSQIRIIENGLEYFASREKIMKKFNILQSGSEVV